MNVVVQWSCGRWIHVYLFKLIHCPACGAFDLGLAVSVPLPIVTGIFVLLWIQSRLTQSCKEIVCNIFCSSLIRRLLFLHMNHKLSSPIMWDIVAWSGRVDADILNGSCDMWGSRDFLPYILYNLLLGVHTITLDSWLVYLLIELYNWWYVD